MKIYAPNNNEIRNRVAAEISGTTEFDYTCNSNEYHLLKEMKEEEFNTLDINSEEHETGNVLVYGTDETYILDELGYFRIKFEPIDN